LVLPFGSWKLREVTLGRTFHASWPARLHSKVVDNEIRI
jgi:hypothetical protein